MSPTYEFFCKKCEQLTAEFYTISKKPDAILCPNCDEVADTVISGGQGFHLAGHGWAFDRYAGKSNFKFMGDTDEN